MDHTVLPANNTIPAFYLRQRPADGAAADCSERHLIPAYYSFIDPEMGWSCFKQK